MQIILLITSLLLASCASSQKLPTSYSGHGATSVSPEILAKFAAKERDPNLMRKIQSYLDIRAPGLGRTSSDGKKLVFSWGITGTRQVWKLNSPLSFPTQMTGGEDRTLPITIAPNNSFILISRDQKGEENPGLYWQSIDGGPLHVIQHSKGVQTAFYFISDDSRFVYFGSNDQSPDSYAIYKYDLKTETKTILWEKPGLWGIDDIHPDGSILLGRQIGSLTREYYKFNEKTKELIPLLGKCIDPNDENEYQANFGVHSSDLLVLTNKFGEFRRLYRYIDKNFFSLTPESIDLSSFDIDYTRTKIFISINDRGYTRLKAYSAKDFKELKLPDFKSADHVILGGLTRNGRFATIGVETGRAPQTNYVLDMTKLGSSQALTKWVLPSSPEVMTERFTPASLEFYSARDGMQIPMFVRRPVGCLKKSCPVVVDFHGGPEGMSIPGFSVYAQLFLDEGFVFVEPNVRGSDGYGKTWLHSDDGAKRLNVITDIEDAAVYIKKHFSFDGVVPKIGITGGSYGGYSTLYGMTRFAGAYDAGVASVGMSNLVTFLQNTAPYRRKLRMTEYGDPEKDLKALVELSPVTYLDRVKNPLLIIQGASDPRVPVGEAIQMHDALEQKGIASELLIFSDEGHGASSRKNQAIEIGYTLDFFKKHLK